MTCSITTSHDCQYLFISESGGNIKQFNIITGQLHHTYHTRCSDCSVIWSMKATIDLRYLFVSYSDGVVKQYHINTHQLVWNYGPIH